MALCRVIHTTGAEFWAGPRVCFSLSIPYFTTFLTVSDCLLHSYILPWCRYQNAEGKTNAKKTNIRVHSPSKSPLESKPQAQRWDLVFFNGECHYRLPERKFSLSLLLLLSFAHPQTYTSSESPRSTPPGHKELDGALRGSGPCPALWSSDSAD